MGDPGCDKRRQILFGASESHRRMAQGRTRVQTRIALRLDRTIGSGRRAIEGQKGRPQTYKFLLVNTNTLLYFSSLVLTLGCGDVVEQSLSSYVNEALGR